MGYCPNQKRERKLPNRTVTPHQIWERRYPQKDSHCKHIVTLEMCERMGVDFVKVRSYDLDGKKWGPTTSYPQLATFQRRYKFACVEPVPFLEAETVLKRLNFRDTTQDPHAEKKTDVYVMVVASMGDSSGFKAFIEIRRWDKDKKCFVPNTRVTRVVIDDSTFWRNFEIVSRPKKKKKES